MRGAVLALTLGLAATAASAIPGLEPGVSRELARWRAQHYRDVRYALAIHIAAGATKLEGTATIDVTLPGSTPDPCKIQTAPARMAMPPTTRLRVRMFLQYARAFQFSDANPKSALTKLLRRRLPA